MPDPVGDVLRGVEVDPLKEGWTVLDAFVVVKCLDSSGNPTWAFRTTSNMNREELLGALTVQTQLLRDELVAEWEQGRDDEEPDE